MIRFDSVSETCLMVHLADEIDLSLTPLIGRLVSQIQADFPHQLIEIVPSYTSILIHFHPDQITERLLRERISLCHSQWQDKPVSAVGKVIELPVYYHPDVGPDLIPLAEAKGLSVEQVIALHSQPIYTVCAIGFAPGFAFLASVDEAIAMPRHAEPRLSLAPGSVGLADRQTAVYPAQSPGGWQIIGNCPKSLFNPEREPMTPFSVGDQVRFQPVDRSTFKSLGGEIWPHWK
ncbi:5-oxoprolinase subunit PxpB [Photobacterium sp. WH77]|uniref:5-oxoprolinase subunit PxpB n=1 Tax=unclassified Photobacterium TaxID=2628852 RepID=UPI001EDB04DB|nr:MULTISPECIES: 5-oxoprolinase subunit PxpB [unclassified Photobacterium]MCG2836043.1 5-oxoprolinase subunit PxpB [Photobacterium sp. WH77]MCG2843822.1 5-oxoprolinase subunit PxpB [Photobacterium sp. WH80]